MPVRTVGEYKESLRDGRNVYVRGERVYDVTSHPILQITVEHSSNVFRLAFEPEVCDLFTFISPATSDKVSRYFMLPRTCEDLMLRGRLIEEHTRRGIVLLIW